MVLDVTKMSSFYSTDLIRCGKQYTTAWLVKSRVKSTVLSYLQNVRLKASRDSRGELIAL